MIDTRRSFLGSARTTSAVLVVLAIVLSMTGCRQESTETEGGTGPKVQIELTEFAVTVDPAEAPAGGVRFEAKNTGAETHEFVIFKTDLGILDLPVKADGSVDEVGAGLELIDEIENIEPEATPSLDVAIEAGNYVFVCNVVQTLTDGSVVSHYKSGMRTQFKAT